MTHRQGTSASGIWLWLGCGGGDGGLGWVGGGAGRAASWFSSSVVYVPAIMQREFPAVLCHRFSSSTVFGCSCYACANCAADRRDSSGAALWITPFGVPRRLIHDQGEFERESGQELEDVGCELMPTAAITPQQNAVCERHGGVWKTHARRLLDEFSVKFVPEQMHRVTWLTAAVAWACSSAIDDSGYSSAQWVLGRGLRLPHTLWDQTGETLSA